MNPAPCEIAIYPYKISIGIIISYNMFLKL